MDLDDTDAEDRIRPQRKTVAFDPYSSEDLDVFNSSLMGEVPSPIFEKVIDGSHEGGQSETYECILTGCVNSFHRPEDLAQHTFEQ